MFNWLFNKLLQIRKQKQHEVTKLKWEKAELEQKLKKLKNT